MNPEIEVRKVRFKPINSKVARFEKIYEWNGEAHVITEVETISIDLEDINWIRFGRDVERYEE